MTISLTARKKGCHFYRQKKSRLENTNAASGISILTGGCSANTPSSTHAVYREAFQFTLLRNRKATIPHFPRLDWRQRLALSLKSTQCIGMGSNVSYRSAPKPYRLHATASKWIAFCMRESETLNNPVVRPFDDHSVRLIKDKI